MKQSVWMDGRTDLDGVGLEEGDGVVQRLLCVYIGVDGKGEMGQQDSLEDMYGLIRI